MGDTGTPTIPGVFSAYWPCGCRQDTVFVTVGDQLGVGTSFFRVRDCSRTAHSVLQFRDGTCGSQILPEYHVQGYERGRVTFTRAESSDNPSRGSTLPRSA